RPRLSRENVERCLEMALRFRVRRARRGLLGRASQVLDRLVRVPAALVVMGERPAVIAERRREQAFDRAGGTFVQRTAVRAEQRAVRGLLGEGVLEQVARARPRLLAGEELRRFEGREAGGEILLAAPGDLARQRDAGGAAEDRERLQERL